MAAVCVLITAIGGCGTAPTQQAQNSQARKAADANVQLASAYLQQGDYQGAMDKLNKALAFDPDYAPAHTVMGVLHETIGQHDKAGGYYQQAAELDPEDGGIQNNYGTWLCRNGYSRDAEAHFLRAVKNPFYRSPEVALTNAGQCMFSVGNAAKAEQYLRQALAHRSSYPDALLMLAQLQYQAREYMSARAFLQRFEQAGEISPGALLLGFRIESELGDDRAATGYSDRIMRNYPDSDQAKELQDWK